MTWESAIYEVDEPSRKWGGKDETNARNGVDRFDDAADVGLPCIRRAGAQEIYQGLDREDPDIKITTFGQWREGFPRTEYPPAERK